LKSTVEKNPVCRLCGFNQYDTLIKQIVSNGKKYSLIRCKNCSFVSVNPLPDAESLKFYYDTNYWKGRPSETSPLVQYFYAFRVRPILSMLKKYVPPKGRILDWGAGEGAWVNLLRREGFDAWGIDPFSIPEKTDFMIQGALSSVEFADNYFDAITCFHVLEHLENPLSEVRNALRILRPGGIIIIEVPNISSLGFALFKQNWQPLQIPIHVNHFTPETLKKVFKISGEAHLLKISQFSLKASPAACVLSLLPVFTPQKIRNRFNGNYPFHLEIIYLALQIMMLLFVIPSTWAKKGCIIQAFLKKL
jgi:2-polyprenyl-3-methyl-5-hydroxy-6-metoxy-1,4-benzoquinol methylase